MSTVAATLIAGLGGAFIGGVIGAVLSFFFNYRWSIFNEDRKVHFEYLSLLRRTQAECDSLKGTIKIIKDESLDKSHIPVKRLPLAVVTTARLAPANTERSLDLHRLLSPVEVDLNLFNQLLELYRANNPNGQLQEQQQKQLNATVCGVLKSLNALRKECEGQIECLQGNEPKLSCYLPPCGCL